AKNRGSRSAPHGLSSASAPPRKAASSPISTDQPSASASSSSIMSVKTSLGCAPATGVPPTRNEGVDIAPSSTPCWALAEMVSSTSSERMSVANCSASRPSSSALLGVGRDGLLHLLGTHVRGELFAVQAQLLGQGDQGVLAELGTGADLAAVEEHVVVLLQAALLRGRESGTCGALGIVSVDVHVPPLDAQLAAVDVLAQLRQGLMRPSRAVGALEVGEDDQDDGSVDGALGQQVVGIARFLVAEVRLGHLGRVLGHVLLLDLLV